MTTDLRGFQACERTHARGTTHWHPLRGASEGTPAPRAALEALAHSVEEVVIGLETPGPFHPAATAEWMKFSAGYLRDAIATVRVALAASEGTPAPDSEPLYLIDEAIAALTPEHEAQRIGLERAYAILRRHASEGTPGPDLDDIEAFVYGMTIAFVEPEMARTFGRAVRERLGAPR